jgi:outer membrane immunogenic protein
MKRILLASVATAALFTSPVFAADPGMPMEEAPVGYYNWAGGYVGAFAGAGWGDVKTSETALSGAYNGPPDINYRDAGFLGGLYGGYNWQAGNFVYGVEAEAGYLGIKDSAQYGPYVGVRLPGDSRAGIDTDFMLRRLGGSGMRLTIF